MKNQQQINEYLQEYYVNPNDVLEGVLDLYDLNIDLNSEENIQITTQKFLDWLHDDSIYGEVDSIVEIKLKVVEYNGNSNKCDFCYFEQFDYCGNMLCDKKERKDNKNVYFIKDDKIS